MLTITDCGCYKHKARQVKFSGDKATMVERLVANLLVVEEGYTYLCEHGYTHRLVLNLHKNKITQAPMEYEQLTQERFLGQLA
ncbi:MAG: hypothetical protein WCD80_12950 [Desulfobaccales bacterium]